MQNISRSNLLFWNTNQMEIELEQPRLDRLPSEVLKKIFWKNVNDFIDALWLDLDGYRQSADFDNMFEKHDIENKMRELSDKTVNDNRELLDLVEDTIKLEADLIIYDYADDYSEDTDDND